MKVKTLLLAASLAVVGCSTTQESNSKVSFKEGEAKPNSFWWPNQVNLQPLRQHASSSNPMSKKFNYAKEFKKLKLSAFIIDIKKVLKDSQQWWPADWGNYGPFFIRMTWHSAGTYRVHDGRGGAGGGQQRFEPLNSWPDNGNLDKARRLLWPIKKKYGRKISWADLMILAGNVAMEDMGFKTFGFAGGRVDDWEADLVYWGPETKMLASHRRNKDGKLKKPLGASQMGLIYVNPAGPGGKTDPKLAGKAIREAFGRMAMNDEETVALIAGGHTFGKGHGARKSSCVGVDPAGEKLEAQGFGWKNKCGKGNAEDTVTSGFEGAWTQSPTSWTNLYFENLFKYEWELTETPAGAKLWVPKNKDGSEQVDDAHVKGKTNSIMMLTTDLALREDPAYRKISMRFRDNPEEFEKAFAKAWFKLTHRDMGPRARYVGREVPKEVLKWQDPIPAVKYRKINSSEADQLKKKILSSGLSISELVKTAWASAASFRQTDMRGGANGARIALAPQKDWAANNPSELNKVLSKLVKIKNSFNKSLSDGKKISLADTIVLGGAAAVEKAARKAGYPVRVPFLAGRTDADQKQTDVKSFGYLEPQADGFRNFFNKKSLYSPTAALIDKANLLALTVPEMTVLVGGLRVLGANYDNSKHGVFTNKVGTLSTDFFVNLFDMSTKWEKSKGQKGMYTGLDRKTGKTKWTATPVDLVFGSHAELRAIGEVYAANDGKRKFVKDFVKAWTKVMRLDRFDLKHSN